MIKGYTYEYYKKSADYIKSIIKSEPEIGIVLGTGLGPFSKQIENPIEIPYKDIPNFLVSTVQSHAGKLIYGEICGKKIICMSGRFHYYEGYSFEELSIPVRVLKLLGTKKLILSNASGAVNSGYRPGDIMVMTDHIKLFEGSTTRGPNVDEFGPRFYGITKVYDKEMQEIALTVPSHGLRIQRGVYMFFPGPQFESPAEIRAARILGADAVGMSTVTEILTAAHCSLPVLGLVAITNMAVGVMGDLKDGEVDETAKHIEEPFSEYVKEILKRI